MGSLKYKTVLSASLMVAGLLAWASSASAASALYHCALGIDVTAAYAQDAKSVTLYVQGRTITLPIAMSGSGAKYSDGKTTLWEHQGEALFEMPGASFTGCKVVPLH